MPSSKRGAPPAEDEGPCAKVCRTRFEDGSRRNKGCLEQLVDFLPPGPEGQSRLRVRGCKDGELSIAIISDTHGFHDRLDMNADAVRQADLVLHLGDFKPGTLQQFEAWAHSLPNPIVAFVPGNHDSWAPIIRAERAGTVDELTKALDAVQRKMPYVLYLQDTPVEINGILIAGWPWHPRSPGESNCTFQCDSNDRAAVLARLPAYADVVATHGPPHGVLDKVRGSEHCGCPLLRQWIRDRKPLLSAFGHVHARQVDSQGRLTRWVRSKELFSEGDGTLFVNAALLSGMTPRSANMAKVLESQHGIGQKPKSHAINQDPIVVNVQRGAGEARQCKVIWPLIG